MFVIVPDRHESLSGEKLGLVKTNLSHATPKPSTEQCRAVGPLSTSIFKITTYTFRFKNNNSFRRKNKKIFSVQQSGHMCVHTPKYYYLAETLVFNQTIFFVKNANSAKLAGYLVKPLLCFFSRRVSGDCHAENFSSCYLSQCSS